LLLSIQLGLFIIHALGELCLSVLLSLEVLSKHEEEPDHEDEDDFHGLAFRPPRGCILISLIILKRWKISELPSRMGNTAMG
jgi:hypothetical protein